jgi:ABC-type antimicrobial peptide transport system permease subunit
MVYIVGIIGFIGGFIVGQFLLLHMLRDRSREDLLNNKALRWSYGVFNWLIAAVGAYSFVSLYNLYFG